ncbi:ABC transporter substrate-binding protein [Bacteroides sp.]
MMNRILYICLILMLTACSSKNSPKEVSRKEGTPVVLSQAKGFSITHTDHYTTVTVYNPWKPGEVYDTYYLVKDEKDEVPADGHKITIPLKSMMTNSATHLGFLELLGELDKVTGVCNSNYIYNPTILQGIKEGHVKDLGDAFNLDIESLLLLHPQAVMTTAYNAEDENSKRMRQTGLNIIYNIEWQEPTLLGRAEWIKFIAAFFDKETMADSIYAGVEKRYNDVKMKALVLSYSPSIFSGQDYRGTWSLPGGKSYTAQLFRDAGARYQYAQDTLNASISSNIEQVLVDFNQADIWIGVQAPSLKELGQTDSKYKLFKAYKEGNVYNINKRTNTTGGNDYWESGIARPDLLLNDMIKICHPNLFPDYELTYYEQLK